MHTVTTRFEMLLATLESLLCEVNERFGIVQSVAWDDTEDGAVGGQLVARYVWSHPEVIDDFVRCNPAHLGSEQLAVARGLKDALYGNFCLERVEGEHALLVHESGIYRACQPHEGFFSAYTRTPLELRGALVPFDGVIVAISPLVVLGEGDEHVLEMMHDDLAQRKIVQPVSDGREFARRARLWNERHAQVATDGGPADDIDALGQGFHRGALAGLTDRERERAIREHERHDERNLMRHAKMLEAICVNAHTLPASLTQALDLLDTEWLADVAFGLGIDVASPELSRAELIRQIRMEATGPRIDMEYPLMWCLDEQFELFGKLLDANPVPIDDLCQTLSAPCPLIPFLFVIRTGEGVFAWMPPEVRCLIDHAMYTSAQSARRRLEEVQATARGLATMCGIITVSEVYERYVRAVRRPLDRRHFDMALEELEMHDSRDDYALWHHDGNDYVISVELSNEGAAARVTREHYANRVIDGAPYGVPEGTALVCMEEEDRDAFNMLVAQAEERLRELRTALLSLDRLLPPHELIAGMLDTTPVAALTRIEALRSLRDFVDAHVPDGEDDYSFADCFVRAIVISAVLLSDSYNATMDIIRIFGLQDCDGTGYSDTLGRLVTNAYNALPRWDLNGWSLEENTQRITGRKRFFNADGTAKNVRSDDPCPCGSHKPYGRCCGRVA